MSGEARTCASCAHAHAMPLAPLPGAIECRERPPQLLVVPGQGLTAMFPVLRDTMGCGRWKSKGVEVFTSSTAKTTEKTAGGTDGKA